MRQTSRYIDSYTVADPWHVLGKSTPFFHNDDKATLFIFKQKGCELVPRLEWLHARVTINFVINLL